MLSWDCPFKGLSGVEKYCRLYTRIGRVYRDVENALLDMFVIFYPKYYILNEIFRFKVLFGTSFVTSFG